MNRPSIMRKQISLEALPMKKKSPAWIVLGIGPLLGGIAFAEGGTEGQRSRADGQSLIRQVNQKGAPRDTSSADIPNGISTVNLIDAARVGKPFKTSDPKLN